MRNSAKWPIGLLIQNALLMFTGVASACTCGAPIEPLPRANRADAVFVAKILAISATKMVSSSSVKRQSGARQDGLSYEYSKDDVEISYVAQEMFKGTTRNENFLTTRGEVVACGYTHFEVGKEYLVYASRTKNRSLSTSICSGTKRAFEAKDEIQVLRHRYKAATRDQK